MRVSELDPLAHSSCKTMEGEALLLFYNHVASVKYDPGKSSRYSAGIESYSTFLNYTLAPTEMS